MIYILLAAMAMLGALAQTPIKCEAEFDHLSIPHQKVQTAQEFYFCFGYHHARDRAWEMDYFRRVAQGRNAELYGFSSLKSDLMMRLLDLSALSQRLYQGLPQATKDLLQAYSDGVNEGFKIGQKAKEFQDLGVTPETWLPEHSILVLTLQSFDQTRKTFFKDYEEEKFKEHWKEKAAALFDEDGMPWMNTIIKDGEYRKAEPVKTTSYEKAQPLRLWGEFPEVFGKESGSNNWAVSKAKSKNGFAILANDPHLDLKTPLFWYWIHLESPKMKVIGASVPGVPVVVSGTNGKLAWALTNAYINTADAVFLKDYPKDYFVTVRPTVKVKAGFLKLPFFLKSFEKTKDGEPVIPLEIENRHKMVLRWTGFRLKSEDLVSMFDFHLMNNVDEMNEALKKVGLPSWNYVFADTKGDIGYRVVGQIYQETAKDPLGMSLETVEEFKSKQLLAPEFRPHVLRPKRQYVYSANNRHWPVDSYYQGGSGYTHAFRGFRIDELLKDGQHDLESFKTIQCDRQSVDARFYVPLIQKISEIPEFKDWKYDTEESAHAPSLYRRLIDLLMESWQVNEFALYRVLENPTDQQKKELMAMIKVARDQVKGRNWGEFHRLTFAHLSKNENWKFSPELPGLGDNNSVDPGMAKWDADKKYYEQFSGASMRMIIIMKEKPEIHLALPGLNRDYTEPKASIPAWKEWKACQYSLVKF